MHTLPPQDHVRRDLTAHLFGFAHVADRCVRPGSGASILNLRATAGDLDFPKYDEFDLSPFPVAEGLGSVYRYATLGETRRPNDDLSLDPDEGALGRMQLLLTFVSNPMVSYCLDEVTASFDEPGAPRGGFPEMVNLAVARATLDEGLDLTALQVALLANVSERTVANAMASKDDSRLSASRDANGCVVISATEADRWLAGRRGYLKTVVVHRATARPDVADAQELKSYLVARIHEEVSDTGMDFDALKGGEVRSVSGQRLASICRVLGWEARRAQDWMDGNVEALDLDDCRRVADLILHDDPDWLTRQLVSVRFPGLENQIEATLTEAGIRSGYFDIEHRFARRFFPEDSIGGRGSDEVAVPIVLHVDGKLHHTDIRLKSQAWVSPRKRFSGYFKSHGAKPGDRVCITRIGEREYKLSFSSQ